MEPGNDKHRLSIENFPDAIAYCQIITDSEGSPVDYVFLDVNLAFEVMTGLSRGDIIGKKVTEVHPGIENSNFDWIGTYGKVALTGEHISFERYFEIAERWYAITAYSDEPGCFATIFRDITTSKKEIIDQELLLDNIETQIWYLKDLETYGLVNQAHADFFGVKKEELENKSLYELMSTKEKAETCIAGNREVFRQKQKVCSEELVLNSSGEERLVSITKTPKLDDNNNVEYVVCSAEDITARKETELQLERSKEKYEKLAEEAPIGILTCDNAGFVDYINDQMLSYLGSPGEEKTKEINLLDFHLLKETGFSGILQECLRTGETKDFEMEYSSYRGKQIYAKIYISPFKEGELITGAQIIADDITERKRFEQELSQSEERFHRMLELVPDMVSIHDTEMNIIYSNWNGFGAVPEEKRVLNTKCYRTYRGFDDICPDCQAVTVLQTGETFQKEVKLPEGVWVDLRIMPILGQDGSVEFFAEWVKDITERKKTTEALRESESKFRFLAENATDVIWTTDLALNYTYISPSIEKLSGYSAEELLGTPGLNTLTPASLEKAAEVFGEEMTAEQTGHKDPNRVITLELEQIHKDGSQVWVENNISFIRDEDGKATGFFAVTRDITERKQAEEALRYHYEFEKMVSEIALYFINLPADQVDEGINYALKECGEFFQVERSYIFLLSPDGQSLSMTHEWHQKEVEPQINRLQDIPIGKRPWWNAQLAEKDYVHLPDVNDMPEVAEAERNEFMKQNIKSLLCIPMFSGGKTIGHLGLDAIKEKKIWGEEKITLLKVLAELISNALERQWSDEKIRSLSFHDQLTGLYNRHFLEEEIQRLDTGRQLPISIIMADLNGLKLVNDTYGHAKGDEMLKHTAGILKKSCRKEDIIARWGGDEFVILLPQTGEEEAKRIESRIIDRCSDAYVNDVPISIALGLSIKEDMEKDLLLVLQEAEDGMYKQKLVKSQSAKGALLKTLRKALEEKSFETEEHTRNMQEIASKIAEQIKLSVSEIDRLELVIALHDIGKINFAENVLTKTDSLASEEWELMKKHPETGYRIALATEDFAHVAKDILSHHEHWDGSGYPQGLKGEEIPLLSRITAIADAYEVMSRGRPYKKALTPEEIKAEFKRCAGTQFDPELVEAFLSVLETDI